MGDMATAQTRARLGGLLLSEPPPGDAEEKEGGLHGKVLRGLQGDIKRLSEPAESCGS